MRNLSGLASAPRHGSMRRPFTTMASPKSCLFLVTAAMAALPAPAAIDPARFSRTTVVTDCEDPMQIDFATDGTLFFIERRGAVKWRAPDGRTGTSGIIPSFAEADAGALAIVLGREAASSRHIFILYTPAELPRRLVLARRTLGDDRSLLATDARILLEIPLESSIDPSHCGGGLAWDHKGNLLIGTGDNSPPQDTPAVHPTERVRDSRRSAANPHDLRGKILRVHPQPDGSVTIPSGNLFSDPADGRPEVFAMGVRNPFKISCDPVTGWITWGDVGGNVDTKLELGPEGFDEINLTAGPGFFGWPFCSGNNAPWRPFDGKTRQPTGPFWDPAAITNDSPALEKPIALPPAKPALIWYGSAPSAEWPFLGSGGRSVTGGLIYRRPATAAPDSLPAELDGQLLFAEWMRNWLAAATLKQDGSLAAAAPFLTNFTFRKPAALATGPDGALYVAEMGDRWTGNRDSVITRISYTTGNRPPVAAIRAPLTAGSVPLTIALDSADSRDPDGDALTFHWEWSGAATGQCDGPTASLTLDKAGTAVITLTVRDAAGATASSSITSTAGNAPPLVRFTGPADGSFFEWGQPIAWEVTASDPENGTLSPDRILLQAERRDRFPDAGDVPPGLALMRKTTCFSCHQTAEKSAGPPYAEVALRYAKDPDARLRLANRIISGGKGSWGELPMPPHPQHSLAETSAMTDWILSLGRDAQHFTARGHTGSFQPAEPARQWGRAANGVLHLKATAADDGALGQPALSGSAEITLRSRRQRAAFFDHGHLASVQDNLDQGGLVARVLPEGSITFRKVSFREFRSLHCHGWVHGAAVTLSLHKGSPDSPALASLPIPAGKDTGKATEWNINLPEAPGNDAPADLCVKVSGPPRAVADFMWIDFRRETAP
jgi:cytochrome c